MGWEGRAAQAEGGWAEGQVDEGGEGEAGVAFKEVAEAVAAEEGVLGEEGRGLGVAKTRTGVGDKRDRHPCAVDTEACNRKRMHNPDSICPHGGTHGKNLGRVARGVLVILRGL